MSKAALLSAKLEKLDAAGVAYAVDSACDEALHFNVMGDIMYVMHDDGSVNIIEHAGGEVITGEVISAANILKVLHHYRPFKEVFKGNVQ
ncbi:MAG: hypothetical protein QM761_13940 [Pseudoxanthomonas sp.]